MRTKFLTIRDDAKDMRSTLKIDTGVYKRVRWSSVQRVSGWGDCSDEIEALQVELDRDHRAFDRLVGCAR